jgi:hypothetical protein
LPCLLDNNPIFSRRIFVFMPAGRIVGAVREPPLQPGFNVRGYLYHLNLQWMGEKDLPGFNDSALLPIEWVERVPKYSPPRGCVPPMAGQNRREQPRFRSGCLASARHLSPIPLRKTESQLRSGQPNHDPTRTDERTSASLCPARGGVRPLGPSRIPPRLGSGHTGLLKTDRNHPLD